jgi:hypothetical protein
VEKFFAATFISTAIAGELAQVMTKTFSAMQTLPQLGSFAFFWEYRADMYPR